MSPLDPDFSRWMRLTDIYARLCARSLTPSAVARSRLRRIAAAVYRIEAQMNRTPLGLGAAAHSRSPQRAVRAFV